MAALNTHGRSGVFRCDPEDHAALLRPRQADVDLAESPTLAVALIVDDQIAVLETEFLQIVAVEAGRAQTVDPGQERRRRPQTGAQRALRHQRVAVWRMCCSSGGRPGDAVAIGRLSAPANTVTRPSVSIRTDISAPTRLRLSAPHLAGQQAGAGNADFRFRRARDHGAVGIAHHDVAQAQRRAAVLVALDLGAADDDRLLAAEILLDRRLQPWRRDVEFDRAAGQAATTGRQCRATTTAQDRDRAPEQPPHPAAGAQTGPAPRRSAFHCRRGGSTCAGAATGVWCTRRCLRSCLCGPSCPQWAPLVRCVAVSCRRPGSGPARPVAVHRGTACAHPTQLAIAPLTVRKRRKEGIWRAELAREARRRRRSRCRATAERRSR